MNIKKNITIHLSEDDVKQIIVEYLNKEGYNVIEDDVTLKVGSRCEGYGMAEHEVLCFDEACVYCKEK